MISIWVVVGPNVPSPRQAPMDERASTNVALNPDSIVRLTEPYP
jgi:hypothetical protein